MNTSDKKLIIFSRFPEPGKVKTRLVPALGIEGAAAIHRQMAEYTVEKVICLQSAGTACIQVAYTGSDEKCMRNWLGNDIEYSMQGAEDIGARMLIAFQQAFDSQNRKVVIIGTDCPALTAQVIEQAFEALDAYDLVLGPAFDGGYYLIGLRKPIPALFQAIEWGTPSVLKQTVDRANQHNISFTLLEELHDIDRPGDLSLWKQIYLNQIQPRDKISVIIPALNEARHIGKAITSAVSESGCEVIVVDGGSHDDTVTVAQSVGAVVLKSRGGRAHQMNYGANHATGGILLFLHADTTLPPYYDLLVRDAVNQKGIVAGAFALHINDDGPAMRFIERMANLRSRHLQIPYGDQALFLRKDIFRQTGGFPEMPIMEDFELIRRLRCKGQIATLSSHVTTSGRRWRKLGVFRTWLLNQFIVAAYYAGVSPDQLAWWYRHPGKWFRTNRTDASKE